MGKVRGEFLCVTTFNKLQIWKCAAWNNKRQHKITDKKEDVAAMTSPSRRRRMTLPPAAMKRSTGSACQRKIHGQVRHNLMPRAPCGRPMAAPTPQRQRFRIMPATCPRTAGVQQLEPAHRTAVTPSASTAQPHTKMGRSITNSNLVAQGSHARLQPQPLGTDANHSQRVLSRRTLRASTHQSKEHKKSTRASLRAHRACAQRYPARTLLRAHEHPCWEKTAGHLSSGHS